MSEAQDIGEIEVASLSDVGRRRSDNQDACGEFRNARGEILLIVADGMGGHRGGATASRICVDAIARVFETDGSEPTQRLRQAFEIANEEVYFQARGDEELEGMGATGVVLLVRPAEARGWLAWAGDSRAYRLRDRQLEALTADHSLVAEWVRAGVLAPDEARGHPRSHELTRAVGVAAELDPEIVEVDLRGGDRFLLCSDGLSGVVPEATLESTLAYGDPESGARKLVERANAAGGPDNVTVQILAVGHADAPAEIDIPVRIEPEPDEANPDATSAQEPGIDGDAPFEAVFNTDDEDVARPTSSVDAAVLELASQSLRAQPVPDLDVAVEPASPPPVDAPPARSPRPAPIRIPLRPRDGRAGFHASSVVIGCLVGAAIVALGVLTHRPTEPVAPPKAPAEPAATAPAPTARGASPAEPAKARPKPAAARPKPPRPAPAPPRAAVEPTARPPEPPAAASRQPPAPAPVAPALEAARRAPAPPAPDTPAAATAQPSAESTAPAAQSAAPVEPSPAPRSSDADLADPSATAETSAAEAPTPTSPTPPLEVADASSADAAGPADDDGAAPPGTPGPGPTAPQPALAPAPQRPPAPLPTTEHLELPADVRRFVEAWLVAGVQRDWPAFRALGFPTSAAELAETWGEREALRVIEGEVRPARAGETRLYLRIVYSWAFESPAGRFRTEDEQRLILQREGDELRWGGHWQ